MKNCITISALMIAGVLAAQTAAAESKPVLTVYTYDGFNSEWGPGPAVEKAFETKCGCDLQWVAAGDAAALLSRVLLEGPDTKADVVLGLDNNLIAAAEDSGLFGKAPKIDTRFGLPITWDDDYFVPYDWGYFAMVYDRSKLKAVPTSFEALAQSDLKVVIEDPRSSSPGLGLVMWVKAAYGDRADEIWKSLADNIVTVTPGWSEAYGLFLKGEADMVLSYTTSPAYHISVEKDDSKAAAAFEEGHYLQVEAAAKLASSDHGALADQFLAFMISPEFQKVIPETNWMYPAITPPDGLPASFEGLVTPVKALMLSPDEAGKARDAAIEEWRAALSK